MVNGLYQGRKKFAKTLEPIQNPMRQNRDMQQVSDGGPTRIRRGPTRIRRGTHTH